MNRHECDCDHLKSMLSQKNIQLEQLHNSVQDRNKEIAGLKNTLNKIGEAIDILLSVATKNEGIYEGHPTLKKLSNLMRED